ncbi:MAG TPA: 3-deoxy-D-manno-octulosonic acid transferase, partial [Thermodesulfobacteriota bacterium]|nr:3-deoxy-D-manno-octulosonic acid transferase [Thermodesulfobacteriota bacterium]
ELLEKRGGGFRVKDSAALFDAFKKVLSDHNLREKTGKNAKTVLEENRGATEKSLSIIEGIIKRHNRRI